MPQLTRSRPKWEIFQTVLRYVTSLEHQTDVSAFIWIKRPWSTSQTRRHLWIRNFAADIGALLRAFLCASQASKVYQENMRVIMHDLTIIIVCYNSSSILPDLLVSLPKDVAVTLVNNSPDDRLDHLASDLVQVITSDRNVGFGVGCNLGASNVSTRYILFLNPDTRLQAGAIDALMQSAENHPDASAFNPVLTDSDGKLRNKRRSVLLPLGHRLSAQAVQCDGVVPVLTGAALLVRADAFFQVGGFDSAIFLYHEDDDLSIRLEAFGPLRVVGSAKVKHEGGHGSGDRIASASIKAFHMGQSRVYAMRKHNRPMPLLRSLGRATLQLLSPATWISRRKRTKQVNFLRGILSVRRASDAST
jgi:N-acetylglucosaminyl-diphospho-decaprenol L-rhamnosyltransferase